LNIDRALTCAPLPASRGSADRFDVLVAIDARAFGDELAHTAGSSPSPLSREEAVRLIAGPWLLPPQPF
jgi:hypothetical protein